MNFAMVSLLVTLSLMVCDEAGEHFESLLKLVGLYLYISFGPMLLMFCIYGFTDFESLSLICEPQGNVQPRVNLIDPFILLIATGVSLMVVCIYSL